LNAKVFHLPLAVYGIQASFIVQFPIRKGRKTLD